MLSEVSAQNRLTCLLCVQREGLKDSATCYRINVSIQIKSIHYADETTGQLA